MKLRPRAKRPSAARKPAARRGRIAAAKSAAARRPTKRRKTTRTRAVSTTVPSSSSSSSSSSTDSDSASDEKLDTRIASVGRRRRGGTTADDDVAGRGEKRPKRRRGADKRSSAADDDDESSGSPSPSPSPSPPVSPPDKRARPHRRGVRMRDLGPGTAFKREVAALKNDRGERSTSDSDEYGPIAELAPGLVGLKNLRNTCFANVIIQALSRLVAVRDFMARCDLPDALLFHVMEVVDGMWAADEAVVSPLPLLEAVEAKYGHKFGHEEDAHWFLELLLQDLRDSLAEKYPRRVDQLPSLVRVATLPLPVAESDCIDESPDFPNSLSLGRWSSRGSSSEKVETSLTGCLARWRQGADVLWSPARRHASSSNTNNTDSNNLGGNATATATARAQRAGARGDGSQSLKRSQSLLPRAYCFHFDRTRWTGRIISRATRSGAKAKVTTGVKFPFRLKGDAISGFRRDARTKFDLVAMVVHDGLTPATGHYYVYLRHLGGSGRAAWFKFDDALRPTAVSPDTVLNDEPFLLFYEQSGDSP
jgi:Ubiquitin carboxyl-terminal hydrolase